MNEITTLPQLIETIEKKFEKHGRNFDPGLIYRPVLRNILYKEIDPDPFFQGLSWERLKQAVQPINWDWPGWLPSGFLTIVAGEPGIGKSMLCLRIAASYIEGKDFPDGTPFTGKRGRVVWCEGEGSQALNIARAEAWGLKTSGIVSPLPDAFTGFRMDDEMHLLNLLFVCRQPQVRLLVMDSLTSLVGGGPSGSAASNKTVQGIPQAMQALREIGRYLRIPILLTHHLRKRTTADRDGAVNLDRIRGTSKIAQMARVIWILDTPNHNDPAHRRLAVAKNNLMIPPDPLGMRINHHGLHFDEPPQPTQNNNPTQQQIAASFLLKILQDGPVPAVEIFAAAGHAGIPKPTLRRAKKNLNIQSHRLPDLSWTWSLPS